MNHQMLLISSELREWDTVQLDAGLARIANEGIVQRDQCFLLASEANGKTNVGVRDMQDKTGYECFINHIHIDDYIMIDSGRQAVCFVATILEKWREGGFEGKLNAIVALRHGEATVRFHLQRPKEFWLAQDLDEYDEAVLELLSSDIEFLRWL